MGLFSFPGKGQQDADDDLDGPVKPRRSRRTQTAEEPIDPMLPEKKRARRRLIGATALVLAAIIGLPMIFDSEPKPLSDDIAIQIPSRDKVPLPEADRAAAETTVLPEAPAPETPKAPPVVASEASRPEPRAEKLAPKADVKSDTRPDATAEDKQASNRAEPAPSAEKSEPKDASRYVIQVAAVASKSKADELQNRLKKAGIKSTTKKVDTKNGERFRVWVGPFSSREEADKMRARLIKLGLSAIVKTA